MVCTKQQILALNKMILRPKRKRKQVGEHISGKDFEVRRRPRNHIAVQPFTRGAFLPLRTRWLCYLAKAVVGSFHPLAKGQTSFSSLRFGGSSLQLDRFTGRRSRCRSTNLLSLSDRGSKDGT